MKPYSLLFLSLLLVGCGRTKPKPQKNGVAGYVTGNEWILVNPVPAGESGYRHLMGLLDKHCKLNTCERLIDNSTCYTIKGVPSPPPPICAATRDGAAELTAEWIDTHLPQTN